MHEQIMRLWWKVKRLLSWVAKSNGVSEESKQKRNMASALDCGTTQKLHIGAIPIK